MSEQTKIIYNEKKKMRERNMKKFEEFENMYERLLENIFEEKDSAANIYKIVHERKLRSSEILGKEWE